MKTTIYLTVPTEYAHSMFLQRSGSAVAIFPGGDCSHYCHTSLEDAAQAAADFLTKVDMTDVAVVHITYSKSLHEKLAHFGNIKRADKTDFNGKPLWQLTAEGARLLNESAISTIDIYPKPKEDECPEC